MQLSTEKGDPVILGGKREVRSVVPNATYKSIAVDLKRPIRIVRLGNRRRLRTAQRAREGLYVHAGLLPGEENAHVEVGVAGRCAEADRRRCAGGPGREEGEGGEMHRGGVLLE